MRFKLVVAFVLVLALGLTACAAPTGGGDASTEGPFRVAIVLPSPITDLAWGQSMYDGLVAVQQEMGGEGAMEIAYSDNMFQVADAAAALRDYASEGYNLIIAHGTQYGNSMFEVARDFPETSFAWGTAVDTGADQGYKNIFAYEANAQEGGYVNGVIAAMLDESGVIGVVGPVEAGDAKLYIDGFVNGVKATNPDIEVNISYTGSFGDTALAAESANTHIKAGADVLTGSAQQVVGAIGVAKEQGVKWLGTQADQSSLGPDVVVANQVYDWNGVIKDMIALNKAGTYGDKTYVLTLENGGLKIVFNDQAPVPDEVKAAADAAIKGVIDGSINPLP
jgi:basic membrane protein A